MSELRSSSSLATMGFPAGDVSLTMTPAPDPETGRAPGAAPCELPALADLPEFRPDVALLKANHIVAFRGNSAEARPFNLLRGQIAEACEQNGYSLLGVVSAVPNEGKSFVAANLAAALGLMPQLEVYLLDLDLRRPSLGPLFGMPAEPGLADYLQAGEPRLAEIGRRVVGTNLSVFPTSSVTADVVRTLSGRPFARLMGSVAGNRRKSRIILCDLPPVFVGDDCMAVARHLDAYIHVVGSGQSTTRQFEELSRLLKDTPCLGSILNRYVGGPFDPYGYGRASRAYNEYFSDPG